MFVSIDCPICKGKVNINTDEFENFPQVQMWVNSACFGLARDDKRIINLSDVVEFLK